MPQSTSSFLTQLLYSLTYSAHWGLLGFLFLYMEKMGQSKVKFLTFSINNLYLFYLAFAFIVWCKRLCKTSQLRWLATTSHLSPKKLPKVQYTYAYSVQFKMNLHKAPPPDKLSSNKFYPNSSVFPLLDIHHCGKNLNCVSINSLPACHI